MTVFVAGYKRTDTDNILGVFADIEQAKASIRNDYKTTEFGYVPDVKEVDDGHIYIAKRGEWYDEWYIVETEVNMTTKAQVRQRLAAYEQELKYKRQSVVAEMERLSDACTTMEAKTVLYNSVDYMKLASRLATLNEVSMDISDIKRDEMFEDDN